MTSQSQPNPNHKQNTTKWFEKSHVVAIGIDDYNPPIDRLRTAVNDAIAIVKTLEEHDFEGQTLLNGFATKEKIVKAITDLKVGENDRLVFYYAGHGIALPSEDNPQGYLIPQDAKYGDDSTYLPMSDLLNQLSEIDFKHVLIILDCCYAGAIRWSLPTRQSGRAKTIYPSTLDLYINSRAWQILTSSDEDQKANDVMLKNDRDQGIDVSELDNHSPFAYFLIQGLQREADLFPSGKGDGIITADELHLYLRNVDISTAQKGDKKRQTPQLLPFPKKHGKGEFVFLLDKNLESIKRNLTPDPTIDDEHNPYRGLESYEARHADCFFGRTRAIEDLCDQVSSSRLTVVLGGSGSGKSSLVKAGLIPHLKRGLKDLEQSKLFVPRKETQVHYEQSQHKEKVLMQVIRPGKLPAMTLQKALNRLENALDKAEKVLTKLKKEKDLVDLPSKVKCLLVIDQFEEIETQCRDEKEQENFWQSLVSFLSEEKYKDRLSLVLTLRSDFESTLRNKFEAAWKNQIGKSETQTLDWVSARFIVQPMEPQELQEVIESPAAVKGVSFTTERREVYSTTEQKNDRTLVQQLVHEVAGMPGALPLLSFALQEIYRKLAEEFVEAEKKPDDPPKREIGWKHYNLLEGGVTQSITRRATEECEKLKSELDGEAHQKMLRWIMLRMVAISGGGLARRSVLMSELNYPEPHSSYVEKVISRFDKARLLIKDKNDQGEYVEPAHDALIREWATMKKWINEVENSKKDLALQQRLTMNAAANEWNRNKNENGYLWDSNAYLPLLENLEKSDDNWLNQLELDFVKASLEERDRQEQARLDSNLEIGITSSQRLFIMGSKFEALTTLIKTRKSLEHELEKYESSRLYFLISFRDMFDELEVCKSIVAHEETITSIGFNSYKNIIASSDTKTIKLWNTDGIIKQTLGKKRGNEVKDLEFDCSGKFLAAADENGNIDLWQTPKNTTEDTIKKDEFLPHKTFSRSHLAKCIRFKSDNETLVSCDGSTVVLWTVGGSSKAPLMILGDTTSINNDDSAANCVAFSPNGEMIAAGYANGVVKLWKSDGGKISTLKADGAGSVNSINFSHDGEILVVGRGKVILFWLTKIESVKPGRYVLNKDIKYVTFSADDHLLALVDSENTITLWLNNDKDWLNTDTKLKKLRTLKHEGSYDKQIAKVCFLTNLDQTNLIAYNYGKTIHFWNYVDHFSGYCKNDRKFYGHTDRIMSIAFSGNGQIIVTTSLDGSIKVWSNSGTLLETLHSRKQDYLTDRIKINRDGQTIIAVLGIGKVMIWRKNEKFRYDKIYEEEEFVSEFDLSSSGDFYATVSQDDAVMKVFDLQGNGYSLLFEEGNQTKVNFDSVGEVITSINTDSIVTIWKVKDGIFVKTDSDFGNNVQYANVFHNNTLVSADQKSWLFTINETDETSELNIWRVDKKLERKEPERKIKRDKEARIVDLHFTGKTILILSESDPGDFCVELYSLNDTRIKSIRLGSERLSTINLNMDCNVIAVADSDVDHYENRVRLWNLDIGNLEQESATLQLGIRSKLEIINEQMM